jgi:PKD repeat protein
MTGFSNLVSTRFVFILAAVLLLALVTGTAPVAAAWSSTTVDSGGDVGQWTSLALDSSGNPRMSYFDAVNNDLKYASWNGATWDIQTVDSADRVGESSSLAIENNWLPRISYYDGDHGDLKYAVWDGSGTGWVDISSIRTVVSAGNVGYYSSLALDSSGDPRISCYDIGAQNLVVSIWTGSDWDTRTVDSTGDVGQFTSLALDASGNPRVSYYDATNGDLKYAAWNGTTWANQTVDSAGDVGQYSSLKLNASGYPRISYYEGGGSGNLKYAAWDGSGWVIQTVDSPGYVGQYTSLALDSAGSPRISYYDLSNTRLKYAAWNGATWDIQIVDSSADVGQYSSLALDSTGSPRIGYYDVTNARLKYAKTPLITGIAASTVSGPAPLDVTFTGTATNTMSPPTQWAWAFGDGGTSFDQSPTYTYTTPGTYAVSLAAYDIMGINISTRTAYITVEQGLPSANFTGTPVSGSAPLTVRFTDSSTNSPDSWAWDFGDNSTENATKQNPVHTYTAGGSYSVGLTAARGGSPSTFTRDNYISVTSSYYLSPPVISTMTPISGVRNQTISFSMTGSNFQPGYTTVEFRNQSTGIISASLVSVTATRINGTITIPAHAVAGPWNIRVATASGGDNVALNKLTITAQPAPTITTITPATGARNTTVIFTITGTNFEPGLTTVVIKNATAVLNTTTLTAVTPTRIDGVIVIPKNAWAGLYNVNISTADGGSVPGTGKFTVTSLVAPTITSITPASGARNVDVSYSIAGTNFEPGLTTVTFRNATGAVLAATTLSSVTPTRINGTISIPPAAWVGAYNVNISTADGGSVPGTGKFAVTSLAPTLTTITPAAGSRNTVVAYSITGTNFEPGTTTVAFRNATGSSLNTTILSSVTATRINGTIIIPPGAWIGAYNVNITTQYGGSVPGTGKVTVTKLAPTITSITPANGARNTTVTFSIAGANYESGTTTLIFRNATGSALDAPTLTSVTPTRINGTIFIPQGAWIGAYNVNITTVYGGSVPGTGLFAVTKYPAPTVSSITPVNMYRNTTVGYAIAGTNFEPGLTRVYLNRTGASDITTIVSSGNATLIRGNVTVPVIGPAGTWNVVVWTADGGNVTKASAVTFL